jgi:small subunit ribosomal protein S16
MLIIRLQRVGKRGQAYFRVIATEHTKKPKGEALEILGSYDPHLKKMNVQKDRIEYWLSKGAQISPTLNNLLVNYKIWNKPKMQSWKAKKVTEAKETETPAAAAKEEVKEENKVVEAETPEPSNNE